MTFDNELDDMDETTTDDYNDGVDYDNIYQQLESLGHMEFGARIPLDLIHSLLEIHEPSIGTKREFMEVTTKVMTLVGRLKNNLLPQGKHLKQLKSHLVIPFASDNAHEAVSYIEQARKKVAYGDKLLVNTPIDRMNERGREKFEGDKRRIVQAKNSLETKLKRCKSVFG